MGSSFKTDEDGLEIIRTFEGLHKKRSDGMIVSYKPIPDTFDKVTGKRRVNSNWTIGYGQEHALFPGTSGEIPVNQHTVITPEQAEEALRFFVANVTDRLVNTHFNARTQDEHNALASWVYNIRASKLEKGGYSLPEKVNRKYRDMDDLISKWLEYCMTPGAESGLYKRRLAEVLMFLSLPWNAPAVWGFISEARVAVIDKGQTLPNSAYMHPTGKYMASLAPEFVRGIAEAAVPIFADPDPPKPPAPVVPVETAPLPEVIPPVDVTQPAKRIEDSKTGKAVNRRSRGKETMGIGGIGIILVTVAQQVEAVGKSLEAVSMDTLLKVAGFGIAGLLALGFWMWWDGRNTIHQARQVQQDPKY
jgi:GH24 family phage-related lysozyme (muramidase)